MSGVMDKLKASDPAIQNLVTGLVVALVLVVVVTLYFGGMAAYGLSKRTEGMATGGDVVRLQYAPGFSENSSERRLEGMAAGPRLGSESYMGRKEGMDSGAVANAIRADLAGLNQVGTVSLDNCQVSPLANADPWLYMNTVEKASREGAADVAIDPHDVQNTSFGVEGMDSGGILKDNNLVFALNGGSLSSRRRY